MVQWLAVFACDTARFIPFPPAGVILCAASPARNAHEGKVSQRAAVARYEAAMLQYGFEAVRESLKQMSADAPIHHLLWGPLVLSGMKTAFKIINTLPRVRRKMAESETRLRDRKGHPAPTAVGA
jgi:hypothetical protein